MEKLCEVGNQAVADVAAQAGQLGLNFALEARGDEVFLSTEIDWAPGTEAYDREVDDQLDGVASGRFDDDGWDEENADDMNMEPELSDEELAEAREKGEAD